jgi:hypothetical protein
VRALDEILPVYDFRESHVKEVDADAAAAVTAFLGAPAAPDRLTQTLLRARGVRTSVTIEELLARLRFEVLHRSPTEIVVGAAGKPWTRRGGIHALADAEAGEVRVAVDVRATPRQAGGCVLSTETRIQATDAASRRAFGRYWRVVGPFSAFIRRRWLLAAARSLGGGSASDRRPPG